MEGITQRQRQVLDFITRYQAEHGYPPTLREISAEIGTSGTVSAMHHLGALERKGYIRRNSGNSRGISLPHSSHQPEMMQVPIIGVVHAGELTLAFEDIEGYCALDRMEPHGGTFFLRVRGDSMVEDAIIDGDLALIRPQQDADNGDIVIALVNEEATLKRFYREHGQVRLEPRNPTMAPITITPGDSFVIVGKVVRIVRNI
jgi:repressor LexA